MVGKAATIRAGLVMAPVFLSWGQLKSTLEYQDNKNQNYVIVIGNTINFIT